MARRDIGGLGFVIKPFWLDMVWNSWLTAGMGRAVDEETLFREIWPGGMPMRDRIAYEAVLPGERAIILARLDAVWRAARGGDLKELAEGIGLRRAAFFNLRRSWEMNSLRGVIPYATRRGRRLSVPENDPLRRGARALIEETAGRLRNVDVARQLLKSASGGAAAGMDPSELQRAERIVQHERRAMATDARFLGSAYGAGILIELSGVQMLIGDAGQRPEAAAAAFVADKVSGLLLGARVGRGEEVEDLELGAITDALEFLRLFRADRFLEGHLPDCNLMLPPSRSVSNVDLDRLRRVTGELIVHSTARNLRGALLPQFLGPRIGRLGLRNRPGLLGDHGDVTQIQDWPRFPREGAEAYFEREIYWHNEEILEAMTRAGLADHDGLSAGRLADVLNTVAAILARPSHD